MIYTYQKLALLYCSMYKFSSENGAICKSPRLGYMRPIKKHVAQDIMQLQNIY